MLGNVSEWCSDWYGPYDLNPQVDPKGPSHGNYIIIKGGSISNLEPWVRGYSSPHEVLRIAGIRLVYEV
jgi:formylglycine-generating enzyme required for sulfatase activity